MRLPRLIVSILSLGLLVLGAGVVSAQDYPTKTIRLVTSPPGGGGDFLSRIVAQGISGPLGQPVIVDNRQVNLIGEIVAKAPPDGYTMLLLSAILWFTPLLQKTAYDPVKDLSPITLLVRQPNILVVHPSLPVKSVQELIDLAKAKPGVLNYGTSGIGAEPYLAAELFKSRTGIDIVGVTYKAAGPAVTALLGGEVQMGFLSSASGAPHIKAGALRALAVTSAQPSFLFPGLPTLAASGLPGYEMDNMNGMFVPAKTPAAIIKRLNEEIVRAINRPEIKEKLLNAGLEIVGSSPEQFAAKMKSDMTAVGKLIKDAGIRVEALQLR
jgi:tripartite-type tricarboxylate transporter receptor subunit TctC